MFGVFSVERARYAFGCAAFQVPARGGGSVSMRIFDLPGTFAMYGFA
ncbi:hypothetical protein [Burkholderia sp. JP2-270]|nr:hypothetical protein [Burkholderia sp. JP2-270]